MTSELSQGTKAGNRAIRGAGAPVAPSKSEQRTARIMGFWFLCTILFSIPAVLLYDPVLNHTHFILGRGSVTRVELGALLEVLTAISNIATAVVIFPIAKRVSETIALGYVASRIVESTLIVLGLISLLSVVTLRQDLTATGSLVNLGRSLVAFHDQTFLFGPQLCAGLGNGILLGYLMWRSGLVPRGMAMIGLVGGPLAVLGGVGVLFGRWDDPSGVLLLFTALEVIWELSLSIWLLVRGFRPSPILTGAPVLASAEA
jgi:hypothetical protein